MNTIFWSSIGAAAGGFVGVILFYLIRLYIEKCRTRPQLITTYPCGNNGNQGQPAEAEGELMHNHGRRVVDLTELQKIGVDHPVWEWTRAPVGRGNGASTIYGPYSTDFAKPGTYYAAFRIKATGLAHPNEITDDVILLQLDVHKTVSECIPTVHGVSQHGTQSQAAIRYIRASELARPGWIDFKLNFYSDAQGVWEYRVIANDGLDSKPDNIGRFGANVRIFFDTVKIYEVKEWNLPSV